MLLIRTYEYEYVKCTGTISRRLLQQTNEQTGERARERGRQGGREALEKELLLPYLGEVQTGF